MAVIVVPEHDTDDSRAQMVAPELSEGLLGVTDELGVNEFAIGGGGGEGF